MDKERLQERLQFLDETIATLKSIEVTASQLRREPLARWQVEHGLQVAIQGMIDIGSHILVSEHDTRVDDYTEVVECLADIDLLDPELAQKLRPLPGLRNILVHEYTSVDYDIIIDVLENGLKPLDKFVDVVQRRLLAD